MRKKYDPREFEKGLERRDEAARAAAKEFFENVQGGRLDPQGAGFNQGEPPDEGAPM